MYDEGVQKEGDGIYLGFTPHWHQQWHAHIRHLQRRRRTRSPSCLFRPQKTPQTPLCGHSTLRARPAHPLSLILFPHSGILTNRTGNGTLTFDTLAALNFAPADVTTTSEYRVRSVTPSQGSFERSLARGAE